MDPSGAGTEIEPIDAPTHWQGRPVIMAIRLEADRSLLPKQHVIVTLHRGVPAGAPNLYDIHQIGWTGHSWTAGEGTYGKRWDEALIIATERAGAFGSSEAVRGLLRRLHERGWRR